MTERPKNPSDIDVFSFQVGMINCFVEMVAVGVKQLAISPPLTPVDYEKIRPYSDQIVHHIWKHHCCKPICSRLISRVINGRCFTTKPIISSMPIRH